MNEALKKALDGFSKMNNRYNQYSDEGKQWVKDNGLDVSKYDNHSDIEYFFRAAKEIGKDDKYVTDKFLLRSCPKSTPESYFISLFKKYEINEVIVTVEANVSVITALLSNGYVMELIDLKLTDAWGQNNYHYERNMLEYGKGLLFKKV